MNVTVNASRCQGHTMCAMAAPSVFRLRDEDGHAYVDEDAVTPELGGAIRNAAATCPEQAITVKA